MKPQTPNQNRQGNVNQRSDQGSQGFGGQDSKRYDADMGHGQGKRMENPASPDLAGDIGKRKSQDYPGADEGLTGESPEDRSKLQGQFGARDSSGGSRDLQGRSEESLIEEDEEDEQDRGNQRPEGWEGAGNSGEARDRRGIR